MNIIHKGSHVTVMSWEVHDGEQVVWVDTRVTPLSLLFKIDVAPPNAFVDTVVEDLALAAKALPKIWKKMQEMEGGDEDILKLHNGIS